MIKVNFFGSTSSLGIYLNVALKREASVLPILYNCGFFLCFVGYIRCHLR